MEQLEELRSVVENSRQRCEEYRQKHAQLQTDKQAKEKTVSSYSGAWDLLYKNTMKLYCICQFTIM